MLSAYKVKLIQMLIFSSFSFHLDCMCVFFSVIWSGIFYNSLLFCCISGVVLLLISANMTFLWQIRIDAACVGRFGLNRTNRSSSPLVLRILIILPKFLFGDFLLFLSSFLFICIDDQSDQTSIHRYSSVRTSQIIARHTMTLLILKL